MLLYLFQPPAFIEETEDSIKSYIEEKYLRPNLDIDAFSPEKAGRDWDFDWFDKAKVPLEPSLPRSAVVPVWELPFRRQTKISESQIWDPQSAEVEMSCLFKLMHFSFPINIHHLSLFDKCLDRMLGEIHYFTCLEFSWY